MSLQKDASDLGDRHVKEAAFHDAKYSQEADWPGHYRYNPTWIVFSRMTEMLGDIRGKALLEYGCGTGWVTAELAAKGADVAAFDISPEAIRNTHDLLKRHDLDGNCTLATMGAEKLDYPDEQFDIVFGFAILHHLDLDLAMPELHRVLKPGGLALFAEPLEGNPFLRIYRRLTPQYRTPDERPLVLREFERHTADFRKMEHEEYFLTAMFPLALGLFRINPGLFKTILKPFLKLDRGILRVAPALGNWAWYSILSMKK